MIPLLLLELLVVGLVTSFVWRFWRFSVAVWMIPVAVFCWSVFLYSIAFCRDGSGTPGQLLGFAIIVSLFFALPLGLVAMVAVRNRRREYRDPGSPS